MKTISQQLRKGALLAASVLCALTPSAGAYAYAYAQGAGAIIKVRNDIDGSVLSNSGLTVKSRLGNLMAVDAPLGLLVSLDDVKGVAAVQYDQVGKAVRQPNLAAYVARYAGAEVVIGIIDNTVSTEGLGLGHFQKLERSGNVGFVTFRSDDPSSTVIMHSLSGQESDLLLSLTYMMRYAETVGRPLLIELNLSDEAQHNPLLLQACQFVAEGGNVQFRSSSKGIGAGIYDGSVQMAFSMFHPETGQVTDRTPFWSIDEARGIEVHLIGSDAGVCSIRFDDGLRLDNSSGDIVIAQVLCPDGRVHYFHLTGSHPKLDARETPTGIPVLTTSTGELLPFHFRPCVLEKGDASKGMQRLIPGMPPVTLLGDSDDGLTVKTDGRGQLEISLTGRLGRGELRLTDHYGIQLYAKRLSEESTGIRAIIDIPKKDNALYCLTLEAGLMQRHFTLGF